MVMIAGWDYVGCFGVCNQLVTDKELQMVSLITFTIGCSHHSGFP
jgi:hypothetical protein